MEDNKMVNWQEVIDDNKQEVFDDFFNPAIPEEVTLEDSIGRCNTAYFDFISNRTHISEDFLNKMHEASDLDPEVIVRGILKHEVGHYYHYPRECSKLMFYNHYGKEVFGKYAGHIIAYWVDIMDNLPQILQVNRGEDVRQLYRGMNQLVEKESLISDEVKKELEHRGVDVDKAIKVRDEYSPDKLLIGYYQKQSEQDLGVELKDFLEEKLEELMSINYLQNEDEHDEDFRRRELLNFVLFGNVIKDLLEKTEDEMPEKARGCFPIGPVIADAPDLRGFSDKDIQEGLNTIIKEWGKERYEKIKKDVEEILGRTVDPHQPKGKSPALAGLAHSSLIFLDDNISYYKRFAATYGMYIHKRPVITDVTDSFRQGQKVFRVGDKMKTLNPFSTGGRVLPGITKRYKLQNGTKKDNLFKVPDLSIWIDSSGSMVHPSCGSKAILAGFALARNYWENGSKVGVVNFSCDTAFLQPTRELQDVYSMLCAWWGGGTALNFEKIKEYMKGIAKHEGKPLVYTTEEDYAKFVGRMHPEKQKEFTEKELHVDVNKNVKEVYQKMDNILLTDGGIWNMEEVVSYLNSTAEITRNTVFILDSPYMSKEWDKLHLPHTQLIHVKKKEDLMGLAIGEVKKMVPQVSKPASLFYE